MKGKVLQHLTGRDCVREAILLHKGNRLKRPLQLLCPQEIRSEMLEETQTPAVKRKEEAH